MQLHVMPRTFDLRPQCCLIIDTHASDSAEIITAWTYKRFATPTLGVLLFSYSCPYTYYYVTLSLDPRPIRLQLNARSPIER